MGMDWGSVPDWIVAVAAAAAAGQGIRSLSTWRREAGGRRRIELAEQVLTALYEVQDALANIRNPAGHEAENSDRVGREGEDQRLRSYRDTYYPILRRVRERQPAFASLWAHRFRAKAVFGTDFEEAFDEIMRIRGRVTSAAAELYSSPPWLGSETDRRYERHAELRDAIWSQGEDDELEKKLADAIGRVEGKLRPIIMGKSV